MKKFKENKELKTFYNQFYSVSDFNYSKKFVKAIVHSIISKCNLEKDSIVLDLGCGTGFYTSIFHEFNINAYGLDLSPIGIMKAKEKYGKSFLAGDAQNLPFKKETFDLIFSNGLSIFNIENLFELRQFGKKILEYLKNGGIFAYVSSSDLSGNKVGKKSTWIAHKWDDINYFFSEIGIPQGIYLTDSKLLEILDQYALNKYITFLCYIVTKFHRRTFKVICLVKTQKK